MDREKIAKASQAIHKTCTMLERKFSIRVRCRHPRIRRRLIIEELVEMFSKLKKENRKLKKKFRKLRRKSA